MVCSNEKASKGGIVLGKTTRKVYKQKLVSLVVSKNTGVTVQRPYTGEATMTLLRKTEIHVHFMRKNLVTLSNYFSTF